MSAKSVVASSSVSQDAAVPAVTVTGVDAKRPRGRPKSGAGSTVSAPASSTAGQEKRQRGRPKQSGGSAVSSEAK
jgi:hypothetical protein